MSKFDILTKYIPLIQADNIGEWVIDKKNDGTPEHPIQLPFVGYSEMVNNFLHDIYIFEQSNKDMELTRYGDILKENGIEWGLESMKKADTSNLDAQCVLALIMGAVRAERFCDGALLDYFKTGLYIEMAGKIKQYKIKGLPSLTLRQLERKRLQKINSDTMQS